MKAVRGFVIGVLLMIVLWQYETIVRLKIEARANDEAATECEQRTGLVANR